jgi:hypothetical protein
VLPFWGILYHPQAVDSMTDNNYAVRLTWKNGVTATPLRNLTKEEAQEYVDDVDLQRKLHGTMSVVQLPEAE